jgi:hypothetical protein
MSQPDTIVAVQHGPDGRPISARATAKILRPAAVVWAVLADVEKFAGRVPMIHKAKRVGDRVTVDLKFKVSILSVGFQFVADATYDEGKWLQLTYVSGEPKDLKLRFDLAADDATSARSSRAARSTRTRWAGWPSISSRATPRSSTASSLA